MPATTPFDNGPFGHILAEPAVQPPTTQPSGFQGPAGTVAQFATNILAGASQGRLRAQAKQEQMKQQNHERLAALGGMIQNSDLQPQIKNNLLTQVGQRLIEQVAYADNGSKGTSGQPQSLGDHAFNFIKGAAQNIIGGPVNKAKPVDEKELMGMFDELHKPENTVQHALYGPGGHNEQLQTAIADLQKNNPMYDRSAIASHQGVQQALAGYGRLGVAPPKFYEEFLGNAPKTPQEALQSTAARQAGAEFMPPPAPPAAVAVPPTQSAATPEVMKTAMAATGFTPQAAEMVGSAIPDAPSSPAAAAVPPVPPPATKDGLRSQDRILGYLSKTPQSVSVAGQPPVTANLLQDPMHPERTGWYGLDGKKVPGNPVVVSAGAAGPKWQFLDKTGPDGLVQKIRINANDPSDKGTIVGFGRQNPQHITTDPVTGAITAYSTTPPIPGEAPPAPPAAAQPAAPVAAPPSTTVPAKAGKNPEYEDFARSEASKLGLDPEMFVKQMNAESGMNPDAVSPKGATGVAQFMPGTAADRGLTNPENPLASIRAGARYMADLTKRYGGDAEKAQAAYNTGPGNVDKAVAAAGPGGDWKKSLPAETKGYLQKISGQKAPAGTMTADAAKAANPFAATAASAAPVATSGAPPAPPKGRVIGQVSPKPVTMSAQQEKSLEFNDKASTALDRFEEAFSKKTSAAKGNPKTGVLAQLGDKLNAAKNQTLYNHGLNSGDQFFDEAANLTGILKAMSAQAYIPGIRNKELIADIQKHIPDPGHDTDAMMKTKIENLRKTLSEHKEAVAQMMDVKQRLKSGKGSAGDAVRDGGAKGASKPASGGIVVVDPQGGKHTFSDQASADAFKAAARI